MGTNNNASSEHAVDVTRLKNVVVAGVDLKDYPDLCDAYVEYAEYEGVALNEPQLDWLNDQHSDWVHEQALLQATGA